MNFNVLVIALFHYRPCSKLNTDSMLHSAWTFSVDTTKLDKLTIDSTGFVHFLVCKMMMEITRENNITKSSIAYIQTCY